MLKKIPMLAIIIALVSNTFAGPVDQKSAALVAKNFYFEAIHQLKDVSYSDIRVSAGFTREEQGQPVYYVFNMNGEGFVIVSADDVVRPVIGYSFESTYSTENQPVQFTEWMDNARGQVVYHRQHKSAATDKIAAEWNRLMMNDPEQLHPLKSSKTGTPLLITTWDQGAHYNDLCPEDPAGPGGRVWAGCVATAMAQVMFYYRWPQTGVGSHSYYSNYGQLSANFGATTYKWDEMLLSLSSPNLATATLLYHLGVSIEMNYSPGGSGASSWDAANALINNFRYASSTHMEDKDSYSESAWAALLKDQIDNLKPMYYHGFGTGGHAFNVDGYQDNDYFHFNWGWSGSYNGYFYLDNLNPGGDDFTAGQGAMIDVVPNGNYPYYCTGNKTVTSLIGTLEDGSGPMLYQSGADCYYLLSPQVSDVDSVSNIILKFNKFNTETDHDFLTIYDGATTSAPVLGSYSGNNLPPSLTSSGNKVLIHFVSDGANNNEGWLLTYQALEPDYCPNISTYTALTGSLSDGSGTKHYGNKSVCQYLIKPHQAKKITLTFNAFQTEPVSDFVEVYDFDTLINNGTLLGRFSGNSLPPAQVSNTGAMFLIFFTNSTITADGWSASYVTQQVGINEVEETQSVEVFPNPAGTTFTISFNQEKPSPVKITILDTRGQLVLSQDLGVISGKIAKTFDISDLAVGAYFIRLVSPDGVQVKRILVQ
ncbi:MAG: C10 family peptidase [Bacteroidetes bacterium]|nr:C10 family peptidase [Bacteroidota bacterium]